MLYAQPNVPEYLAKEWSDDYVGAMVGYNHHSPLVIAKHVVTALSANPAEPCCLRYLAQLPIRNEAEPRHDVTSTRQVPTKSGSGSSGSAVLR